MPLTDEQKRTIITENRQIIAQLQERASFVGPREKAKPSLGDVFRSPDPFKTGLEALGVPGGLQKEAIAAKGFVTFPYDLMKDIVLPTYKGTAKALYTLPTKGFGAAQKVVEEEVKPHQQQAIQMAKAFGGGVLDWMKMSLLPDTPAGIVAKQRIGDRIKEHGYLAEAVHPAVLLGLVRGGAKRFTTKKPSPLAERLGAIEKSEIGVPRKVIEERLKGIEELGVPPKVEPVVKKAVPKKIVVGEGVAKTTRKLKAEGVGEAREQARWKLQKRSRENLLEKARLIERKGELEYESPEYLKARKRIETLDKEYATLNEQIRAMETKQPPPAPAGKAISPRREADLRVFADRSIDQVEAGKPAGRTFVWPEAGERGPIQPRITADASTYPQWYRDLTRDYSIKKSQTIKALKQIKEKGMEADGRQYVEAVKEKLLDAMTEERSRYAQEILKERAKRGVLTPVEKELHAFFEKKGKEFKLTEEVKAKPGAKQAELAGLQRAEAEAITGRKIKKVTGTKAIKEEMLGRPEGEVLPGQESLRLLSNEELAARRKALPKYRNESTPKQQAESDALYGEQRRRYDLTIEQENIEATKITGLKHGDRVERAVPSAFGFADTYQGKVIKDRGGRLTVRTSKPDGTGRKTFPINKAWKKVGEKPAPAPTGKPKPAAREPWEMTKSEWVDGHVKSPGMHLEHVRKALSEGKPVPEAVLKEYPELAKGKISKVEAQISEIRKDYPDMAETPSGLPIQAIEGLARHPEQGNAPLLRQRIKKYLEDNRSVYKEYKSKVDKVPELKPVIQEYELAQQVYKKAEYPKLGKKGRIGKAKTALDVAEKKALDRIKKRGTRLTAGIDPAEMADLAIIGAAKIAKGTIKFGEWSAEMVREFGARVKPYLKRIYARSQQGASRLKANAELESFVDYFEDIQAPKGLRPPRKPARAAIRERLREEGLTGKELTAAANAEFIVEVNRYGIALRQTKGGKVTPAIREAGTYVPDDFATYGKFKDAKAGIFGGTKDASRFVQEIDGALSVEAKAKLSGQAGPAERYVLHRTRDMVKSKLRWTNAMKSRLATITKGASKKQLQTANQVIEHISREGAYVGPAKLVTNPKISAITKDVKVVRLAQEGRKLYESLLRHQNELRRLRGQTEIPHRDYYTAHSIHETTIWERAVGHNKTPKQTIGPGLPDYIKPNAPFNARAMAREVGLPETVREMNLQTLLERYIETAGKDIYNTSIIQNNKAFIQQLESMGYRHAARGLENWTAEAFGGVKGAVDRAANLSPTIHKGMSRFRQGLIRSVFPLNFAWNTFVQTSSGVLTYARYGNRNSIRGLYDWFGSRKIRQEIRDNAYSAIIKSQRSGRISRQDINRGVGAAQRLSRGKLEKVSDAANFFTEWVERHLTGWSVATAKRHGAAKGLKGKALWEYASDGGAKTQSMYNLEDLPGMLRSELIKTGGPFQTFSFEVFNTLRETAGKTGTPPATNAIRIKMALRFLAGVTAVNYIGQAAIGRKPWELSSFIPFYGAFFAPVSAALRGEDVSMTTTRGLPSPIGIAIKGGQAVHRGVLKPGVAATKELIRTGDMNEALEEFMATGKWDKLRRFTVRYLSGFAGIPGGTQMNRVVDGLIAVSAGGMVDSAGKLMFPITDTKDKMRTFLAGPWASKGGQEYWDKRGKELDLYIESLNETPLLRDVVESLPVVSDLYKFGPDSPEIREFNTFFARSERKTAKLKELETQEEKAKYYQENKAFFRKVGEKSSGEKVYLPQALRTIDRKISKHRKQIREIESGTVMVDKKPVKLTKIQKRIAISNLRRKIEGLAKAALKLRK